MSRGSARAPGAATPSDWKTRLPRKVHWLLFGVLGVLLYFGVLRRYRIVSVETPTVGAILAQQDSARMLVDRLPPHAVPRESIVWWMHEDTTLFSRVVGVPGDRFVFTEDRRWVRREENGTRTMFPPEIRFPVDLANRVLAPEEYVLLADHPKTEWTDSRTIGVVTRPAIRYRVILTL